MPYMRDCNFWSKMWYYLQSTKLFSETIANNFNIYNHIKISNKILHKLEWCKSYYIITGTVADQITKMLFHQFWIVFKFVSMVPRAVVWNKIESIRNVTSGTICHFSDSSTPLKVTLGYWGLHKMATILQTSFSYIYFLVLLFKLK